MAGKTVEENANYTFETIDEGSRVRVQFEVGDEMIGRFEGIETVEFPAKPGKEPEVGYYLNFRYISGKNANGTPADINTDEPVAVSQTYQLAKIQWEDGAVYRLYCRSTTPVSQGNDMLNFTVQKAK